MILSCPACGTRYRVDDSALAGGAGRTVRCANCGHTWRQPAADPRASAEPEGRIEPALEVPPRPGAVLAPSLEVPPRPRPLPEPPAGPRRHRGAALRWFVLAVLFARANMAGIVAARGAVVAIWPPAARLYTLAGLPVESFGPGLKVDRLTPTRTPDGLVIEGDIVNPGKAAQDVPRLRVALRDLADKEVQFKIVDPPTARLPAGARAHFKTPFDHPDSAATGVVVTFVKR
jgi:predicted Zn finger-like uncharacterized protein